MDRRTFSKKLLEAITSFAILNSLFTTNALSKTGQKEMKQLDVNIFENWLKKYFQAWEEGDPKLITDTFAEDGEYNLTPFTGRMKGKTEIYKYWEKGAQQAQENVITNYQIITVKNNKGYAKWQAQFDRKGKREHVRLDGIMEVTFNDKLEVEIFNEWWHMQEEKNGD